MCLIIYVSIYSYFPQTLGKGKNPKLTMLYFYLFSQSADIFKSKMKLPTQQRGLVIVYKAVGRSVSLERKGQY